MRFVIFLMWLLHWLPLPILGRIGKLFGSLMFARLKKRRDITLTNLALCFPDLTASERETLAREHFQNYARSILERGILWWASEARIKKLITIEANAPIKAHYDEPVIFLCPHFVCLDVAAATITMQASISTIYVPQHNAVFDHFLKKGRERFNPFVLISRRDGIKPIYRLLKKNKPYLMLPDMDFGRKGAEFVPFFDVPAATLSALPRLTIGTGAKVIPIVASFLPDYKGWRVKLYPAWENYPADNDIIKGTQEMNRFIESCVRESPSEYFWMHRRFKTRPTKSDASFYND